MDRTFSEAEYGNIALTSELDLSKRAEFTVCLSFGSNEIAATMGAISTLGRGYPLIEREYIKGSVAGAILSDVSDFESSNWQETAWWRAKRIEPKLLKYLEKEYPYNEQIKYEDETTKNVDDISTLLRF